MAKPNKALEEEILAVMDRNLQSIWDGDGAAYSETTSEDCTFFEWYISPQRIDGLDFHLREIRVHRMVVGGGSDPVESEEHTFEHEILQPNIQVYGSTVIVTFTLMVRVASPGKVVHKSHNETRVFNNFGTKKSPDWKLVHCHKSPIATPDSMSILRF